MVFSHKKWSYVILNEKKTRNRIMIVLEKLHDKIGLQIHLLWEFVVQIMCWYRSSKIVSPF